MGVDPLDRNTGLTRVGEPAGHDLRCGEFEIGVRLDDDRCVVAELEADLLPGCTTLDAPSDLGRPGEGDVRDVVMVDDRVADAAATTDDDVQPPGRKPAFVEQHLGQQQCSERRLRGGLQHHRAPCGDRGSNLVGYEVQRKVERADRADDPDRESEREAELAGTGVVRVHGDRLAGEGARLDRGEPESAHRSRRFDACGLDRFSGFAGDRTRELVAARFQPVCGAIEDGGALMRRHRFAADVGRGGDGVVDLAR